MLLENADIKKPVPWMVTGFDVCFCVMQPNLTRSACCAGGNNHGCGNGIMFHSVQTLVLLVKAFNMRAFSPLIY